MECAAHTTNVATPKTALITGVTGQDGSYLAELLLEKGYHVHGLIRRSSNPPTARIDHLRNNPHFFLHYADLTDSISIYEVFRKFSTPIDEVYNLAAQSHVQISFQMPLYTSNVDGLGVLTLLDCIVNMCWARHTKFYQASTSELFGSSPPPQNEFTPFHPRSPYAVAKLYAYWMVKHYREAHDMFAVNGILFNHESPRRGLNFVTRKVTRAVVLNQPLVLGNLNAVRDWGHAKDYVEAMWLMLQQDAPHDLVIGTGITHSVRELVREAYGAVNRTIEFRGYGLDEVGYDKDTGEVCVTVDKKFFRLTEVENLQADPSLAREILKWSPKITFSEMIYEMVSKEI